MYGPRLLEVDGVADMPTKLAHRHFTRARLGLAITVVGLVSVSCTVSGCSNEAGTADRASASERSEEHSLACMDAGGYVPENHPTVAIFRFHLDSLERKCPNNRHEIAATVFLCRKEIQRYGTTMSLLQVIRALDTSIPVETGNLNLDIKEIAAAYVFLGLRQK
jgi:hypothetical protein